jgi:hypothetical protein
MTSRPQMGYSHLFAREEGQIGGAGSRLRRNDIPRISAASFAECVVIWDFGRAHFPLNAQGAVVRLASGQVHHMLVRLLLIGRLLVQALTHLWVHSLALSQISPSSRRLVPRLTHPWAGPRILMLSHKWVPWICRCIVRCLISPAGSPVGYARGVIDDSPTGSSIGSPADPWVLVVLTNLRHGLASGLFAGAILVSAMGSRVGLRVLHGWLDRGSVSRLKAPIGAPGSSRVGCRPMQKNPPCRFSSYSPVATHWLGHFHGSIIRWDTSAAPSQCDDRYV